MNVAAHFGGGELMRSWSRMGDPYPAFFFFVPQSEPAARAVAPRRQAPALDRLLHSVASHASAPDAGAG